MTEEDIPAVALIDAMSLPLPWSERAYRHELGAPHSRPWVAEVLLPEGETPLVYRSPAIGDGSPLIRTPGQHAVIGFLVLWKIVDEAHIATLAVHPRFRRQGVASLLLRTALDAAAEEGTRVAYLEVRASNASAQRLYRAFGFQVVGRRRGYYRDSGEDALIMAIRQTRPSPLKPTPDEMYRADKNL